VVCQAFFIFFIFPFQETEYGLQSGAIWIAFYRKQLHPIISGDKSLF
jgi:hypothetical protein